MDPETALFIASAIIAAFWSTVIGILHVRGWLPKAYTDRLAAVQSSTATQIGNEVAGALEDALRSVKVDDPQVQNPLVARFDGIANSLAALSPQLNALPSQVGSEVGKALDTVLQKAVTAVPTSGSPEISRQDGLAMGTDAAAESKLTKTLKTAVGQDLAKNMGPIGDALDLMAPSFKAWILEHPDKVDWAMSQPWVRSLMGKVQAWIAQNPQVAQVAEAGAVAAKMWWEVA